MSFAKRLRRERTNAASKPDMVFYAPSNVTLPYGKLEWTVSGRGSPGNPYVPGNVASYNAPTGGNLAGYNPEHTAYNPPTPAMYVTMYYTSSPYWEGPAPTPYTLYGYYSDTPRTFPDPSDPNQTIAWINVDYPGNLIPGNGYNVPETAYYNPVVPGVATYNPATPGVAGEDSYVLGVQFPGGAIGTTAPTVPPTKVLIPYQNAPVAIYVPPGGSVSLKGT